MRRRNTYLLFASLLGMIMFPAVLLLLLQSAQYLLKQTAEERLAENKLHTFSLKASGIKWEKYGKELRIDGSFFDVKKIERSNGMLLITGHFDDEETGVWEAVERLLHHAGVPSLNGLFLLLQCLLPLGMLRLIISGFLQRSQWIYFLQFLIPDAVLYPPYSPPRNSSSLCCS